jgi:tetratricopeptide (TPR) repeat protein
MTGDQVTAPNFDWLAEAVRQLESGDATGALSSADKAAQAARSDIEWAQAENISGTAQLNLGNLNEAVSVFSSISDRFSNYSDFDRRDWYARAGLNKALILGALNRNEEALVVYNDLVARFGTAMAPALRQRVASALVNKGIALTALDRHEEAIAVYSELIARFGAAPELPLRETVATALVDKGLALAALHRDEEAITAYDDLLARFGTATEPALREQVAIALLKKGAALEVLDRNLQAIAANEAAIVVYNELVARFGTSTEPALRQKVNGALANKGVALKALERNKAAIPGNEPNLDIAQPNDGLQGLAPVEPRKPAGIMPNAQHQTFHGFMKGAPYELAIVEFDDQGRCYDRGQMDAVAERLEALAPYDPPVAGEDVILVVFVHGWQHDARSDDDNLWAFRTLLSQTVEYERAHASPGVAPRPVLGVFVGWRGLSEFGLGDVVADATFWSRQAAGQRVAAGSVRELFGRLRHYRNRQQKRGGNPLLVIVGHSFGGMIVFSALAQSLIQAASAPVGIMTPEFADLVLLVNPAIEGARYIPIYDLVTSAAFKARTTKQLPVFICAQAENDQPVGMVFPLGNGLHAIDQATIGDLGSGLIAQSQKATAAAMQIAEK